MPTVTDIKRQRRTDTRYNVYLDGVYAFALSDLDLSTSGLRVGQELAEAEVQEYQAGADQARAYAMALRFLAVRPRSRQEMQDYLLRKECAAEVIEEVLARLLKAKLLDDQAFAATWTANRQLLRPRSKRRLEQELLAKGVARDEVAVALDEIDPETEVETVMRVAERKQRLSQYRDREKLIGYLARQGYEYGIIKKALRRLDEQAN